MKRPEPEEGAEKQDGKLGASIEIEQENKAIAVNGRLQGLPYTVDVINQYAGRVAREGFVDGIIKQLPEFFKDNEKEQAILERAAKLCSEREESYIAEKCAPFVTPFFDYAVDAH